MDCNLVSTAPRPGLAAWALILGWLLFTPALFAASGGRILSVSGPGSLKRAASGVAVPATTDTLLGPGDTLTVGPSGQMELLFDGRRLALASNQKLVLPVEPEGGPRGSFGEAVDAVLQQLSRLLAEDPLEPSEPGRVRGSCGTIVLLKPVGEALPEGELGFEWKPLGCAPEYRFELVDGADRVLIRQTSREPRVARLPPGTKLEPGRPYRWSVSARATQAKGPERGVAWLTSDEATFWVLSPADLEGLEFQTAHLRGRLTGPDRDCRGLLGQALLAERLKWFDRAAELAKQARSQGHGSRCESAAVRLLGRLEPSQP